MAKKRVREGKRKKQAKFAGLPVNINHRSHASGVSRFIRSWVMQRHYEELKKWEENHEN